MKGEFLAAVAAGPVFELLGKQSLRTEVWPSPDTPILNDMGYFMHNGPHSPLPGDYVLLAKFMEKHFGKPQGILHDMPLPEGHVSLKPRDFMNGRASRHALLLTSPFAQNLGCGDLSPTFGAPTRS